MCLYISLQQNLISEWKDKYLDYRHLNEILRKIDCSDPSVVYEPGQKENQRVEGGEINQSCSEEQKHFLAELGSEVSKVEEFYFMKINEGKRKLSMIILQLQQLGMNSSKLLPAFLKETYVTSPPPKQQEESKQFQQPRNEKSMTWTRSSDQLALPSDENKAILSNDDNTKSVELTQRQNPNSISEPQKVGESNQGNTNASQPLDENALRIGKTQAKNALLELYRFLELLKSYRELNINMYKNLVKRYEKLTNRGDSEILLNELYTSTFYLSTDHIDLMNEVEDLYRIHFANGNRERALKKLRTMNVDQSAYFVSLYFMVASVIFSAIIIFLVIYIGIYFTRPLRPPREEKTILALIYFGLGFFLLNAILIGINMYIWDAYKINYRLISGLNPRSSTHHYFAFITFLTVIYLVLASVSLFGKYGETVPAAGQAWITIAITFFIFYFGLEFLDKGGRNSFLLVMYRIISSPIYTTRFQNFFIGDQLVSIIPVFQCFGLLIDFTITGPGVTKGFGFPATWYNVFLQMLPYWWRSMQCIRRYYDGLAVNAGPTQFYNCLRYLTGMIWLMFWGLYIIYKEESALFILTIIVGCIFSLWSYYWDIVMDWGLGGGRLLAKHNSVAKLIYYPVWTYYFTIIIDLLERFVWLPFFLYWGYKSNPGIYILAFVEIHRRFIWNFYRMEIEHVRNCEQYQVTPEIPLPYATTELFSTPNVGTVKGFEDGDNGLDEDEDDIVEAGNITDPQKAKVYKQAANLMVKQNETYGYLRNNEQQV
jgi:hypothetical protein